MRTIRNQKGFTLVELIVVIVILGIIAGVAVPNYINMQTDAQAANNVAYIGALRSALAMRFGQQLVRTGNTAPAGTDVIGDAATADADQVYLDGLVGSPIPATLTPTAGICGTGQWDGLAPGNPPAAATWTITCGATVSDPISIAGP
ncbi:MAG: prepilin-type N-terminal cleavage/methylation domain-containing protein [Nitrospiria bacterium]